MRILENPKRQDRYIATTQVGISVASLGLGMYGEHVLADWIAMWLEPLEATFRWIAAHAVASVIAVSFLTYLHIVIGEMVPKALALQSARPDGAVRVAVDPGNPDRAVSGGGRAERDWKPACFD